MKKINPAQFDAITGGAAFVLNQINGQATVSYPGGSQTFGLPYPIPGECSAGTLIGATVGGLTGGGYGAMGGALGATVSCAVALKSAQTSYNSRISVQ